MQTLALALIRLYQIVLSPYIGWHCRFMPSCSAYARESILAFGLPEGLRLTALRLWRCRPGGGGGYDPVPHKHPSLTVSALKASIFEGFRGAPARIRLRQGYGGQGTEFACPPKLAERRRKDGRDAEITKKTTLS